MPTGYTADIYDGKDVSLTEFATGCAHAFGAFIHQRDDNSKAVLTYPPKPDEDSYHARALAKAEQDRFRWNSYSEEDKYVLWSEYYEARLVEQAERVAEKSAMRERYERLLDEVHDVEVPEKLENFKKFMMEQLTESMKFDCPSDDSTERWYNPREYVEWCKDYDEKVERDIKYHEDALTSEWANYYDRMSYIKLMERYFGIEVEER